MDITWWGRKCGTRGSPKIILMDNRSCTPHGDDQEEEEEGDCDCVVKDVPAIYLLLFYENTTLNWTGRSLTIQEHEYEVLPNQTYAWIYLS